MAYYLLKIGVTVLLVVAISEIAKRSSLVAGLLASVPLVSVLAMIWLYIETRDAARVSALATSIFWLVIPSLALFASLPLLLKAGLSFPLSLGAAITLTVGCYYLMVVVLKALHVML